MAADYTHGHHPSVLRSHRWRTIENSAAYLLPELTSGRSLLDVGCGPGTITVDFARRLGDGRVVGVDASAAVIAEAARENGSTAAWTVADAYDLPFPSGSFDIVHAHQLLQHLDDPVRALRGFRRIAAEDGLVAARDADYAAMSWYPSSPELDEWQRLYRVIAADNGGEPDAGRRLKSWAFAAGFRHVTATASSWCFTDENDRAWWADLWADRIRHSAVADRALSGGYASVADLERMAVGWRRWADAADAWFVVVHGEVVCRP